MNRLTSIREYLNQSSPLWQHRTNLHADNTFHSQSQSNTRTKRTVTNNGDSIPFPNADVNLSKGKILHHRVGRQFFGTSDVMLPGYGTIGDSVNQLLELMLNLLTVFIYRSVSLYGIDTQTGFQFRILIYL